MTRTCGAETGVGGARTSRGDPKLGGQSLSGTLEEVFSVRGWPRPGRTGAKAPDAGTILTTDRGREAL